MNTQMKEYRDSFLTEAFNNNPNLLKAKKFIFKALVVWISSRILFSIFELTFILIRDAFSFQAILNILIIGIGILFAYGIYKGQKACVYLPLAGGVLTITNTLTNTQIQEYIQYGDILYNTYVAAILLVGLIQLVIMFIILLNRNCKEYFKKIYNIDKSIIAAKKNNII